MKKVVWLFGLSCFFSVSVADTVNLKNGDQISGDIIKMGGKSITVDTKYAGEIVLKWEDIATLKTDNDVTLMRPDRSRIKGRITSVENGRLELEGGTVSAINLAEVAN